MISLTELGPGRLGPVSSVPTGLHLSIGVIARDGLPYLRDCLKSIPDELDGVDTIDIILVDSGSSDGTSETMAEYAAQRDRVRVFRMDGKTNAAATRNVILRNAEPGIVLLVDGDIILTGEFLLKGLQAIKEKRGDAVSGGLTEIQHDTNGKPITDEFWRTKISSEVLDYGRWACGIIMLSADVLASGLLYDESMRLNEDRDFTIRLTSRFRALVIPVSMGCHLTRSYYSADRLKQFYRDANYRWLGMLLRKHLLAMKRGLMRNLLAIIGAERGVFLGFGLQAIVILGLFSGQMWLAFASLVLAALDFSRFVRQRRLHEYLPLRVVGPWMVLGGMIMSRRVRPVYEVRQVV